MIVTSLGLRETDGWTDGMLDKVSWLDCGVLIYTGIHHRHRDNVRGMRWLDGWINLIFILLSDRPFEGHRSTAWDTPPSPRAPYVMKSYTSAVANHTIPSPSPKQKKLHCPHLPFLRPKIIITPSETKPTPSSPCPVVLYLRKYLYKRNPPRHLRAQWSCT